MIIDTHSHIDGPEFDDDRAEVVTRAKAAGIGKIFLPGINAASIDTILPLCRQYPGFFYAMLGLHPEEVKDDWREQLSKIKPFIIQSSKFKVQSSKVADQSSKFKVQSSAEQSSKFKVQNSKDIIAIGEVGLDYYWSREYEKEQLEVFEEQVKWSVETQLPLMIHCRKGQNEMVHLLRHYEKELPGGVFHCFTGNQKEAEELLRFDRFCLGVGGVLTFKSSHLREDLPAAVPLERIVLETDSPYMAPVPYRGKRNESAYVVEVWKKLAEIYNVSPDEVARITNENVARCLDVNI